MNSYKLELTEFSPEITLDHNKQVFRIKGTSRPEDVSVVYCPTTEWLSEYRQYLSENNTGHYSEEEPLIFELDLDYFNSSSAKYLYEIVEALKKIKNNGVPVEVAWRYDDEDIDMREAGEDLSILAELDFTFIPR